MCMARWITVYGAVGVHGVEQRVDNFVAADAEQGRAEDSLGLGVDQNFHETLGLAALLGAPDARHLHLADQCLAA